jgi:hypothetical protein
MTVAATITALQTKHAAFSGVSTAPTAYPTSLPSSDLPLVLTDFVKGKSKWESYGGDFSCDEQQFLVRCYVLPIMQGQGIDEGKQATIALLDTFLAGYKAAPILSSTTSILIERGFEYVIPRDGIVYADVSYYGFTIVLPIEERTG